MLEEIGTEAGIRGPDIDGLYSSLRCRNMHSSVCLVWPRFSHPSSTAGVPTGNASSSFLFLMKPRRQLRPTACPEIEGFKSMGRALPLPPRCLDTGQSFAPVPRLQILRIPLCLSGRRTTRETFLRLPRHAVRGESDGGDVPVFHKKTAHDDLFAGNRLRSKSLLSFQQHKAGSGERAKIVASALYRLFRPLARRPRQKWDERHPETRRRRWRVVIIVVKAPRGVNQRHPS